MLALTEASPGGRIILERNEQTNKRQAHPLPLSYQPPPQFSATDPRFLLCRRDRRPQAELSCIGGLLLPEQQPDPRAQKDGRKYHSGRAL